jgi:uncharacterized repeat protein (TIGR04044 family)
MAQIVGERVSKGDAIVDYDEKVFEDIQAEPGEKAYILMHTVPFEGSVGLVNMLTATRINRKGFDTHLVLYGPGWLMAAATRGYPKVGDEPFPGAQAYNRQLQTFMNEGGHVYACRFSAAALYGMREIDMMEGVKAIEQLDVLDPCSPRAARTRWSCRPGTVQRIGLVSSRDLDLSSSQGYKSKITMAYRRLQGARSDPDN